MTLVYHYHRETGELLGADEAELDPLERQPLVPAHSTVQEPPAPQPGEVARFDGEEWHLVPDHRGESYWLADGSRVVIMGLGVAPPPEALSEPPPPPVDAQIGAAHERIDLWHGQLLLTLTKSPTRQESDTWPMKAAMAKAFRDGTATPNELAMLDAERAETGETREELVQHIEAEAAALQPIIGRASGLRRQANAAIKSLAEGDPAAEDLVAPIAAAQDAFKAAVADAFPDIEIAFS